MHAVARIVLDPMIPSIQTSWVKMGPEGAKAALAAGANDLGGSLMNESITRAAGSTHGQEMSARLLEQLIADVGRAPRMRTTLYRSAPEERCAAASSAPDLAEIVLAPVAQQRRRSRTLA
jgi:FO synthase